MERFWSRVHRDSGDGCWTWQGVRRSDGYGQLMIGGKMQRAHRVSWELTNGPIPEGRSVLHRCDNPPCVRPDHLFVGSQRDNLADMTTKGRRLHGERHPWHGRDQSRETNAAARLTTEQVSDIRAMGLAGYRHRDIAARFGVHTATIGCVLRGQTWQGVEPSAVPPTVERLDYRAKLSYDIALTIRRDYTGKRGDLTRLAERFGVSRPTIRAILDGRSYPSS